MLRDNLTGEETRAGFLRNVTLSAYIFSPAYGDGSAE